MKIKCTNVGSNKHITEGQVYESIQESREYYTLVNDIGQETSYYKERFEIVPEPLTEIQIGDTVKVLRAGDPNKGYIPDCMDRYIGQEFQVESFNFDGRIRLSCNWVFEKDTLEIIKRKDEMNYTTNTANNESAARIMVKNRNWIVGSINSEGEFSIASKPSGHLSESAAKAEAQRLAGLHNGKTFIVLQLRAGFKAKLVEEI
jgi:hypothetical protein